MPKIGYSYNDLFIFKASTAAAYLIEYKVVTLTYRFCSF